MHGSFSINSCGLRDLLNGSCLKIPFLIKIYMDFPSFITCICKIKLFKSVIQRYYQIFTWIVPSLKIELLPAPFAMRHDQAAISYPRSHIIPIAQVDNREYRADLRNPNPPSVVTAAVFSYDARDHSFGIPSMPTSHLSGTFHDRDVQFFLLEQSDTLLIFDEIQVIAQPSKVWLWNFLRSLKMKIPCSWR
jgi:hypothetical protein